MAKWVQFILFSFLILFHISCQNETKQNSTDITNIFEPTEADYYINAAGDTFPARTPISIRGKILNSDSLAKPKTFPLKRKPKIVPFKDNSVPAKPPKVVEIPKDLTVITPGENGVPLPKSYPIKEEIIPVSYPKPVPASLPKMKDAAIADIRYLSVEEGMSSFNIWHSLEDRRGNLWFGTASYGVSRYDGNSFTHFTPETGFNYNTTWSLLEDKKGNIWFGGALGGGIGKYDGNAFTHIIQEKFWVHKLFEDRRGNIWAGTDKGAFKFEENSFTWFNNEYLNGNTKDFLEDEDGNFWLGTTEGLKKYDGKSFTHYSTKEGLVNNRIMSMVINRKGNIWLGTQGGLSIFNGKSFSNYTVSEGLNHNHINDMLIDDYGQVWFSSDGGGLSRFDASKGENGSFYHFTNKEGLSHNNLNYLRKDQNGNIWASTWGGGINRFNGRSFTSISNEKNMLGTSTRGVIEDKLGRLWVATWAGGLIRINPNNNGELIHYTTEQGLVDNNGSAIMEDSRGNIWFGSTRGVSVFHPDKDGVNGRITNYTVEEGLATNWVSRFCEDLNGDIWISCSGLLVKLVLDKYGKAERFIHYTSELGTVTTGIVLDQYGNIWFGTRGGICKLLIKSGEGERIHSGQTTIKDTLIYFPTRKPFLNGKNPALSDSKGNIWMGTVNDGVIRIDPKEELFTYFTKEDGLVDNTVSFIVEDKDQNIWLGNNRGLSILTPLNKELLSVGDSTKKGYKIHTLTKSDGLKPIDKYGATVDSQNRLWIATNEGLTSLDLNQFEFPSNKPTIHLTHIEIAQNFIDFRGLQSNLTNSDLSFKEDLTQAYDSVVPFYNYPIQMTLPHHLNHLTFHFSAIDWASPYRLQYQYRMKGEKEWSPLSAETKAEYRNLSHGDYTFQVKAIGAAKKWSDVFEYSFTIRPPWWQTIWAYIGYILLAAALIYAFLRWRTYSLRVRVMEKTQEIRVQQKRSDDLLLNILPAKVARELKETGKTQPVFFEEVSILFADFKGFTNIVASIPGKILVQELDDIFKKYDDIMEEVGLEKIQTVGDAYLAACGLPSPDPDHAKKCVLAAQRIIDYLEKRNQTEAIKWSVRIGIHSGPITAGVIGKKKFSYDLFGDTINIAARIESSSEPGRINVSAYTYRLIKDTIPCTYRGKIDAKGKGELDMYFVE